MENATPWTKPTEAKEIRRNLGKGGKYEKPQPKKQFEPGDDLAGDPAHYREVLGTTNLNCNDWDEL